METSSQKQVISTMDAAAELHGLPTYSGLLEALDQMEKAQAYIDALPMFPTSHATDAAGFRLYDAREAARALLARIPGSAA